MWDEGATQSEVPVTSLLNEAAAQVVDSTVTHGKQSGVPRESLRLCEKTAGKEDTG